MAKFTRTFEKGTVKNELVFNGNIFDYTMGNYVNGVKKSDKKCFSSQINEIENINWEDEDIDVDMLDCEDDDEITEILGKLDELERREEQSECYSMC